MNSGDRDLIEFHRHEFSMSLKKKNRFGWKKNSWFPPIYRLLVLLLRLGRRMRLPDLIISRQKKPFINTFPPRDVSHFQVFEGKKIIKQLTNQCVQNELVKHKALELAFGVSR